MYISSLVGHKIRRRASARVHSITPLSETIFSGGSLRSASLGHLWAVVGAECRRGSLSHGMIQLSGTCQPPYVSLYSLTVGQGPLQSCRIWRRSPGSPGKPSPLVTSKTAAGAAGDPETGATGDSDKLKGESGLPAGLSAGQLYLVAVAALWGSYAPALR